MGWEYLGHDRVRPPADGLIDERDPVGAPPGQREEQVAGDDPPAVHGNSRDRAVEAPLHGEDFPLAEVVE